MVSRKDESQVRAASEALASRSDSGSSDVEPFVERAPGIDPGLLHGVRLHVRAELGRRTLRLEEALRLRPGALIDLDTNADEPVGLWVDDLLVARGVVVVVDDRFCVRVTEVLPAVETVREGGSDER